MSLCWGHCSASCPAFLAKAFSLLHACSEVLTQRGEDQVLWDAVVGCEVNSLYVFHVGQIQLVEATLVGVGDIGRAEVMAQVLE